MLRKFKKIVRILEYALLYKHIHRSANADYGAIKKVGVLVQISRKSRKFSRWHDGFVAAIEKLKNNFDQVDLIFFEDHNEEELLKLLNNYDFIIVKSGWRSEMDFLLRKNYRCLKPALGLMISASNRSPSLSEQLFYDVVWYETEWYRDFGVNHPNALHAFGVDTDIMKPMQTEKIYDWICIGAPKRYKRIHLLVEKPGEKLYIGDLISVDKHSKEVMKLLADHQVTIKGFSAYVELAEYYNQSEHCYVPCELHGGGERAVLEARACGITVTVENDNPKLKELLTSPVWDHTYYYQQLLTGIRSVTD